MKILIANEPGRHVDRLAAELEKNGCEVARVESGWEILDVLVPDGQDTPCWDVIVTDTRIAFPDGLTIATLVRGNGFDTRFVVTAGLPTERMRKVVAGLKNVVLLGPDAALERVVEAAMYRPDASASVVEEPAWTSALEMLASDAEPS